MGLFFKVSLLGTAEDRASPGRVMLRGQLPQEPKDPNIPKCSPPL